MKRFLILVFAKVWLVFYSVIAQDKLNIDFASPLRIPLIVSGTFGEIRTNHFHSGLDFKTQARIGIPVYSVFDGYVSRVNISPNGYGKALYITHPNGFTSVYAHLSEMNETIENYITREQYNRKSFAVDITLSPNEIVVKRDEMIGYSGNTGGSGGPHLHFEIRETDTEKPINPLLFNFKYKIIDTYKPNLQALKFYEFDSDKNLVQQKYYWIKRNKKGIETIGTDTVIIHAPFFSLGVKSTDRANFDTNPNGVYSISIENEDVVNFQMQMDKLDFDKKRMMNAHVDFKDMKMSDNSIHKCYKEPNNSLEIYPVYSNEGLNYLEVNQTAEIKISNADAHGNTHTFQCVVKREKPDIAYNKPFCNFNIDYDKAGEIDYEGMQINFPQNAFYSNACLLIYTQNAYSTNVFSKIYQVHNEFTPIDKAFQIQIVPENLPEYLKSKALIVYENEGKKNAVQSVWAGVSLMGESREFGKYYITIDTVKPIIQSLNFSQNSNIINTKELRLKIADDLSGIKSIQAYMNGNWLLMEHDPKTKTIQSKGWRYFDQGNNTLNIYVEDYSGNIAEKQFDLISTM